jgi:Mrp family chromosome partitioning ATPase
MSTTGATGSVGDGMTGTRNGSGTRGTDWVRPRVEAQGVRRSWEALRAGRRLILLTVALALGTALVYLATADPVYEASTDLLVTPVANDDPTLQGLGLIPASSDPTRDVETASLLVRTPEVARRVRDGLGLGRSPSSLIRDVRAEPVAQSNIVTVTARGSSRQQAARLANAFGEGVVAERTDDLHRQLDRLIPQLERRESQLPRAERGGDNALKRQRAVYETLRGSSDPTLRVTTRADLPSAPISPRPVLSLVLAGLAGLVLGVGGVFALQLIDPRVSGEDQLRERYRLPILARVPQDRALARRRGEVSPAVMDAYRMLRVAVASGDGDGRSRTALITGSSPDDGKSTTAISLARSLAASGRDVILIEVDLRRPSIAQALGVTTRWGTAAVLTGEVALEDALVDVGDRMRGRLRVLVAQQPSGAWLSDLLSGPDAEALLAQAKDLAEWVVVDSPPVNHAIDTLPMARAADRVVLVVRLGHTKLPQLEELGELVAQHDIRPTGFVVVGAPSFGAYD